MQTGNEPLLALHTWSGPNTVTFSDYPTEQATLPTLSLTLSEV